MHVLITNDDGPPSDSASPYIHHLANALKELTDWKITVVLPHTQRSWIGKAHMIGQTLTASYIYPSDKQVGQYAGPFNYQQEERAGSEEWILLDGTPASCTNVGLHYFNGDKPFDLVISGPNFGRNSGALYIMSSGTVGAAMEGALCGVKSIGLSYAYQTKTTDVQQVIAASKLSVKIIKHLYDNWNSEAQLYSINVPLYGELTVDKATIVYTEIFDNLWGASFQPEQKKADNDPDQNSLTQFVWKPNFAAVDASVKDSGPNTDAGALNRGHVR
jgi:tubulin--tyrosine ligase